MPPQRSPSPQPAQADTSPYPRHRAKQGRLQFTACGACRMRRVKCDLKELNVDTAGPNPACTNCKERNLKCIDEYSMGKPTRLLRRGRRIQKVEAIYGKDAPDADDVHRSHDIPRLHSQFFRSGFWRWFSLQHPILDNAELPARFAAHDKGSCSLSKEGQLLFMVIVVWAASYGINEKGGCIRVPSNRRNKSCPPVPVQEQQQPHPDSDPITPFAAQLRIRLDAMISELVELVDLYGILRNPTWDGVRVLLLMFPLLEGHSTLQQRTFYDLAISQARVLCTTIAPSPHDAVVRSRVFWYAHLQDSCKGGLRNGRLIITDDDIHTFEVPVPEPPPMTRILSLPVHIGHICRKIHDVLLSPAAKKRIDLDVEGLLSIWDELETCWNSLGSLLDRGAPVDEKEIDLKRFVAGWRCFLFECHNIIRLALTQNTTDPSSSPTTPFSYLPSVNDMHATATSHCFRILPAILQIINKQLACDDTIFFKYDCGRVQEAVYYAGILVIEDTFNPANRSPAQNEEVARLEYAKETVKECLRALHEIKWVFSKSELHLESLKDLWRQRQHRFASQAPTYLQHALEDTHSNMSLPIFDNMGSVMPPAEDVQPFSYQTLQESSPFQFMPPPDSYDTQQQATYHSPGEKWGQFAPEHARAFLPGNDDRTGYIKPSLPPLDVSSYYYSQPPPNTASSSSSFSTNTNTSWAVSPATTAVSNSSPPSPTYQDMAHVVQVHPHTKPFPDSPHYDPISFHESYIPQDAATLQNYGPVAVAHHHYPCDTVSYLPQ